MAIATAVDDKLKELHAANPRAILVTTDYLHVAGLPLDKLLPEKYSYDTEFDAEHEFINNSGIDYLKCYIHGDAEDAANYDIPWFRAGVIDLSLDEQPCTLILDDARCLNCTLHIWRTQETGYGCSFIVANADEESAAYARKCRAEKRRNI